jgi:hypothetical protein
MVESEGNATDPARSFEELTNLIAARLSSVCAHMPSDEFTALVSDIARMKLRFAQIDAQYGMGTNPIDRLSEEPLADQDRKKPRSDA